MSHSRQFICPTCNAILNQDEEETIRFLGVLRGHSFTLSTTVDLSAELGVYGAQIDKDLVMEDGCKVDFLCPQCGRDLTASYSADLAEIKMVEAGHEYVVVFSKVYGERTSFVVDFSTKRLVASYGEDAAGYVEQFGKNLNFFGS